MRTALSLLQCCNVPNIATVLMFPMYFSFSLLSQVMQYQAHAAAERAREEAAAQEHAHQAHLHAQAEAQAEAQRQAEEKLAQQQAAQKAQRANTVNKANNAGTGTSAVGQTKKEAAPEPVKKKGLFW